MTTLAAPAIGIFANRHAQQDSVSCPYPYATASIEWLAKQQRTVVGGVVVGDIRNHWLVVIAKVHQSQDSIPIRITERNVCFTETLLSFYNQSTKIRRVAFALKLRWNAIELLWRIVHTCHNVPPTHLKLFVLFGVNPHSRLLFYRVLLC